MLGVLLAILKIILWIVLALILLVLLLVLLVLFMPIRYQAEGEFHDTYSASAKIKWLGARILGNISTEEGIHYKVKFLGITLMNNDEEYTEKQAEKEAKQQSEKHKKRDKPEKQQIVETAVRPEQKQNEKDIVREAPENRNNVGGSVNSDTAEKREDEEQEALQRNPKQEPHEGENASFLQKLSDVKETVTTKKEHIEKFMDKPFTKRTIDRGKKCLLRILKEIRPRKASGNLIFGLSNPADTGIVIGAVSMLLPIYGNWLHIEPDFYHQTLEGDLQLKGKIRISSMLFPAARIYFSKDFKRTLALAKKI